MAPGTRNHLAPPCSNLRSFGSKSAVEESTFDIVRTFRRPHHDSAPGELRPLALLVTPLDVSLTNARTSLITRPLQQFNCSVASRMFLLRTPGLTARSTNATGDGSKNLGSKMWLDTANFLLLFDWFYALSCSNVILVLICVVSRMLHFVQFSSESVHIK